VAYLGADPLERLSETFEKIMAACCGLTNLHLSSKMKRSFVGHRKYACVLENEPWRVLSLPSIGMMGRRLFHMDSQVAKTVRPLNVYCFLLLFAHEFFFWNVIEEKG